MDYRNFAETQMTIFNLDIDRETVHFGYLEGTTLKEPYPDVLFVSENCEIDVNEPGLVGIRSCFSSNRSSDFFKESLKQSGISNFYITGCVKKGVETDDENHMILKLEIENFKPQLVVALGRKAEKMLLKVKDIATCLRWFDTIPHPSFWLTFYSHQKQEYVYLLKDLKRKVDLKSLG